MLTAVLIDDEPNALEVLRLLLQRYCTYVQVLACCDSAQKGMEAIKSLKPNLVFLDIEMPQKNGFDVLTETAAEHYQVIFTTAYNQFAIKAFKVSAVDYLLKPIDILELQSAVEKARKRQEQEDSSLQIRQLLHNLTGHGRPLQKVAIPVGDGMQLMPPNDIIRAESDSNYTHLFLTSGKKISLAKTLKDVEERMGGYPFFRLPQSHLVNLNHVVKIYKGENGYIITTDGAQIAISRAKKDAFMASFYKV